MATPRRQPRPAADQQVIRAKLSTMTYSFAQQMPHLPTRPTPPPPLSNTPTPPADDPNFPKLTPTSHTQTGNLHSLPRAWQYANKAPNPGTASRWANPRGKTATAAEVVASNPSDSAAKAEEDSQSEKHQAELALYSKLVPTTSAVPRNPGRSLGGGGLRSTGSVAAQKQLSAASASHKLTTIGRKEPLTSRMRNLSSDASKPQLARRVATKVVAPLRATPATPPTLPAVPSCSSSSTSAESTDVDSADNDSEKGRFRESAISDRKDEHVIAPKPDAKDQSSRPPFRRELPRRSEPDIPKRNILNPAPRRLDEAFGNGSAQSGIASRRNIHGPTRRSSALSPPPPNPVRSSPRNGNNPASPASDVPPGFEGRPNMLSRGSIMSRGRAALGRNEGPDASGSKGNGRDNPLPRPKNARADALREALNSRRKPSPPRAAPFRRPTHAENHGDLTSSASLLPKSIANRRGSDLELSRPQLMERKNTRPVVLPAKQVTSNVKNGILAGARPVSSATPHGISEKRSELPTTYRPQRNPIDRGYRRLLSSITTPDEELRTAARTPAIDAFNSHLPAPRENVYTPSKERSNASIASPTTAAPVPVFSSGLHNTIDGQSPIYEPSRREGNKVGGNYQLSPVMPVMDVAVEQQGNGCAEALVNDLLGDGNNGYQHGESSLSLLTEDRNGPSSSGSLASFDIMRGYSANPVPSALSRASSVSEDVLPPLPSSQDVGFESMLRSMGWTPLDDEDALRISSANGGVSAMRQNGTSNGAAKGRANSFYTHFQ